MFYAEFLPVWINVWPLCRAIVWERIWIGLVAKQYRAQVTGPTCGFDWRLEPIAFDTYTGGSWLEERKLVSQPPSITVSLLKIWNVEIYCF